MGALNALAALTRATIEPGVCELIAEQLEDLEPRGLQLAFEHLNKYWLKRDQDGNPVYGVLPLPAEIRELAYKLQGEERNRRAGERAMAERKALEARRREHPEEYMSYAECMTRLADPPLKTVATLDLTKRRAQLQAQKVALKERA